MELWLGIASRREVRSYADRPIPHEVQLRILDAGRLSGSTKNRQPWRFVVVESAARREPLAELVYAPENISGARLIVAIAVSGKGPASLDAGPLRPEHAAGRVGPGRRRLSRTACPTPDPVGELLGLREGESPAIVLTFGYPASPRDPAAHPAEEWSARANRKPLADLVERI